MARRPRPTHREMDSLQRRYDAVVATLHRVLEERQIWKNRSEMFEQDVRWERTKAGNILQNLRAQIKELETPWYRKMWDRMRSDCG